MKLGRSYQLDFTCEELLLLAYNMVGTDEMQRAGINSDIINNIDRTAMASLREKIKEQMKAAGKHMAGSAVRNKDAIWRTIGDAAKG